MKRKALMVALFCIMGLMLAGVAQADQFTCTISQVGIMGGQYYQIYLTDNAGTGWTGAQPFLIPTGTQTITNGMYATALTAFANSTNVWIDVFNPNAPNPVPPNAVIADMRAAK
jgi:hypothetical protein